MYHSFLIHSSADGHLGCFHVLAIINSAVMNIGVHVYLSILNRHFSKEDIQMANKHMKMLSITHYQRNANKNHNEVPFHASQNGCDPKVYKQ